MKKISAHKFWLLVGASLLFCVACTTETDNATKNIDGEKIRVEETLLRENGKALVESGKAEDAIAVFDQLIEINPQNFMAYNGKAVAFDHAGNHLAAQDLYKTALSISPDSAVVKNNLAMSFILNNQPERAIKILSKLSEDFPDNQKIRHNLAFAYGVSGKLSKAKEINLRDMSAEQAEENNRYYASYISEKKTTKNKKSNDGKNQDDNFEFGFVNSDVEDKPSATKDAMQTEEQAKSNEPNKTGTFWGKPAVYEYPR